MTGSTVRRIPVILAAVFLAGTVGSAQAQSHRDRPLTIKRHPGGQAKTGIEVRNNGNEVIAWGGFSGNGYGYGRLGAAAARREASNEAVRLRTGGVYGYGFDGLGGTGTDDDLRSGGYNNPSYGNAYNSYVGYNGVPTALAFGPGFANRHITDSDDADLDLPGPTPGEIGYSALPAALDTDD